MTQAETITHEWLTVEQTATRLQFNPETLWRWIRDGRVPERYIRRLGSRTIRLSSAYVHEPVTLEARPHAPKQKVSKIARATGRGRGRPKGSKNKPRG